MHLCTGKHRTSCGGLLSVCENCNGNVTQKKRKCSPSLCMQLLFLKLGRKQVKTRMNDYRWRRAGKDSYSHFLNSGYSNWSSSWRTLPQKTMMIAVMTVMRMMKVAAAPLPLNVEINTRKKRGRRKRKRKKRRRRKRESVNHLNLTKSQNLTDRSHLLRAYWPLLVNYEEISKGGRNHQEGL